MSLNVWLYIEVDTGGDKLKTVELFDANITHNLGKMAKEAEIYYHLWRPDEIGMKSAGEIVEPLEKGLALMKSDPKRFEKFNASNGWVCTRISYLGSRSIWRHAKNIPKLLLEFHVNINKG